MNKKNKGGFTLLEIMIVVAIIGLLATIAIPSFLQSRATSQQNACINNLRQIDSAKDQWAIETHQAIAAAVVPADLDLYLNGGTGSITCPADQAPSFWFILYHQCLGYRPCLPNRSSYTHTVSLTKRFNIVDFFRHSQVLHCHQLSVHYVPNFLLHVSHDPAYTLPGDL